MTPLYNGNDYYKKMLDLQERLRKSEEERIRLEERFTLLEHESRSRHETCINRLRMRYIDFLEEQQARDERNHQLLGALDRVDSSLALMSAKTDRLGTLRKQYEASIRAPYENRRPNGSVTGDSGVASQNDERQGRCKELFRANGNEQPRLNRGMTLDHQSNANRTNDSSARVRQGSSYGNAWSGIRCESSPMHQPSFAFSPFTQTGAMSLANTRNNGTSGSYVDNSIEDTRSFLRSKNSLEPLQSTLPRSLRYGNSTPQSSHVYRNNDSSNYQRPEYPSRRNTDVTFPASSFKYDRSSVRDLAASHAYESASTVPRFHRVSPEYTRDSYNYEQQPSATRNFARNDFSNVPRQSSIPTFCQSATLDEKNFLESSAPRMTRKLSEILRQELVDEEQQQAGSIVENQLERYISKIRSLHRDAEPQSLDDMDQEQNTSGDLLNVTLSDDDNDDNDGLDLPIEEKPRERFLTRELGNVIAIANDLANQTATSVTNVANNIYHDIPAGDDRRATDTVGLQGEKFVNETSKNNEPTIESDGVQKLSSINRPLDETESYENVKLSSYERHDLLAKSGISVDFAKPWIELASRSDRNIRDIAKLNRNRGDDDVVELNDEELEIFNKDKVSGISVMKEKCDNYGRRSSRHEDALYATVTGVESENDENFHDIVEDLEAWNLGALERRVQEIILNDEARDDLFARASNVRDTDETLRGRKQFEQGITGIEGDSEVKRMIGQKIDECIDEKDNEIGDRDVCWKNDEAITSSDGREEKVVESAKDSVTINEEDTRLSKREGESLLIGEESTNRLSREAAAKVSRKEENIREKNYVAGNNVVDTSIEHVAAEAEADSASRDKDSYVRGECPKDPNLQYEYNDVGEYQGDPNEQYHRYSSKENVRYDGVEGKQYEYSEQRYVQDPNERTYVQDPNQRNYVQDPNQLEHVEDLNQQESVEDPNQREDIQDPNQQDFVQYPNQLEHVEDPNQQAYVEDPNQRKYVKDPNQQEHIQDSSQQEYVQDPNQQVYVQDPNQREYVQDPSQQEYVQDPNQHEFVQDPNQQYIADPNQQYPADPNQQYPADLNQQYPADHNQQYPTDPNQQYPADPNQQYLADPNQQYSADPNQQYPTDPNQQYPEDPNQQYPADPNQQYLADPNQQYPVDPSQQYPADPNQQYPADPNQQYSADPNQQYPADPNQQYPADPNQQYFADPNQQYSTDPNQQYSADPNQQYVADPNQQYVADPNHQYVANPNQQYPENGEYAQGENQSYPAVGTAYPYSKAQEYPDNEGYVQGQEGSMLAHVSEENVIQDSSKVINDDQPSDRELERTASVSETKISSKEEMNGRKTKDVIKSILDSDTESTIEKNVSNTESDFDFN